MGQPSGNVALVDFGIQNEESDLRAHVCPNAGFVYVYPTCYGLSAIQTGKYRLVPASQPGANFVTAEGYLVPPTDIWGCIPIKSYWFMQKVGPVAYSMSTSAKGEWAVAVVQRLLSFGWFPFWGNTEVIKETDIQIKGIDIIVKSRARIQVKCDFDGGEPKRAGSVGDRVTGNLFLQIRECNPFRRL